MSRRRFSKAVLCLSKLSRSSSIGVMGDRAVFISSGWVQSEGFVSISMGKKKVASTSATDALNTTSSSSQNTKRGVKGDPDPLPLAQYVSLVGTHTLLLLFCMVFMPRSTSLFMELPAQASSQDRPQAEWMAPITVLPSWSVGWMCLGAAAVQMFWAGKLRNGVLQDEGKTDTKLDEARAGMKVCPF